MHYFLRAFQLKQCVENGMFVWGGGEMPCAIMAPIYMFSIFSSGTFQLTPTSTYPQLTVIVSYSDQRAPQLAISTPLSTQDEFGDLITEAGAGPQASFIDDLKAAKLDSGCKAKVVFQPIHRR